MPFQAVVEHDRLPYENATVVERAISSLLPEHRGRHSQPSLFGTYQFRPLWISLSHTFLTADSY